jgi:hypothetical protein
MSSIPTRVRARKSPSPKSETEVARLARSRLTQAIDIYSGGKPLASAEDDTLYFTVVGQFVYRVCVADRRLYDREGNEVEGLAMEARRLIVISPTVEPDRREEVAYHELYHCWRFHIPRARKEEDAANLFAAIVRQCRIDLECSGGLKALITMRPSPIALPFSPIAKSQLARVEGGAA